MDVGPILKRHGLLDLKAVTEKLERRVVEHFNELLREFRFALNSHDFLAKASRRVVVMAYCKKCEGDGAGVKLMCVCERNVTESDRAFEKPATLIQDLLTDARSDASEIIATLDKMQLAMDAQHQLLVPNFSEATRGFAQSSCSATKRCKRVCGISTIIL